MLTGTVSRVRACSALNAVDEGFAGKTDPQVVLLVANEVVGSRVKPLGENLERWGACQAIITNQEINRIATDAIADVLWTPSPDGNEHLAHEGVPAERVELGVCLSVAFVPPFAHDLVVLHHHGADRNLAGFGRGARFCSRID